MVSEADKPFLYDYGQFQRLQKLKPWNAKCVIYSFQISTVNCVQPMLLPKSSYLKSSVTKNGLFGFFERYDADFKMVHAASGNNIEVMGLLTGKVFEEEFIVMDSFALPVEGTETRVNAQAEANEYMVQYMDTMRSLKRYENVVGWYHSHPGYGCWLSGIDIGTQREHQQLEDPYLAIVIDPHRTLSSGLVDIGAFRTYPQGYVDNHAREKLHKNDLPLGKVEDFGVHAHEYYFLHISYFQSESDRNIIETLWGKYWAYTLVNSSVRVSPDFTIKQLHDLAVKLDISQRSSPLSPDQLSATIAESNTKNEKDVLLTSTSAERRLFDSLNEIPNLHADGDRIQCQDKSTILSEQVKTRLFNWIPT